MLPEDTSRMAEMETLYVRHVDTVYRICYSFLKNQSDAEDAVQETFLKLLQILQQGESFADDAHEKAWLIVTASETGRCRGLGAPAGCRSFPNRTG